MIDKSRMQEKPFKKNSPMRKATVYLSAFAVGMTIVYSVWYYKGASKHIKGVVVRADTLSKTAVYVFRNHGGKDYNSNKDKATLWAPMIGGGVTPIPERNLVSYAGNWNVEASTKVRNAIEERFPNHPPLAPEDVPKDGMVDFAYFLEQIILSKNFVATTELIGGSLRGSRTYRYLVNGRDSENVIVRYIRDSTSRWCLISPKTGGGYFTYFGYPKNMESPLPRELQSYITYALSMSGPDSAMSKEVENISLPAIDMYLFWKDRVGALYQEARIKLKTTAYQEEEQIPANELPKSSGTASGFALINKEGQLYFYQSFLSLELVPQGRLNP